MEKPKPISVTLRFPPEVFERMDRKRFEGKTTFQDVGAGLFAEWLEEESTSKISENTAHNVLQKTKQRADNKPLQNPESEGQCGETLRDAPAEVSLQEIYALNVTGFRDITETLKQVLAVLDTVAGSIIRLEASIGQLGNLVRQPKTVSIRNKKTSSKPKKRAG